MTDLAIAKDTTEQKGTPKRQIPPRPAWLAEVDDNPTYEWARLAWDRGWSQPGAWFDYKKADFVAANWSKWFTLTEDRFAGVPFRLNVWQEIIVRFLIGFKIPTEIIDPRTGRTKRIFIRLFRRLYLWIPRKNGKSEFLAALGLMFFAVEGVKGGQGYNFASDEDQARYVFNKMCTMVASNAEFAKDAKVYNKSIYLPTRQGARFNLLTGRAEGKHGASATVIVGDEMHEWHSDELANTLRQSTGARLQPIELYASTAGKRTNATAWGLWEKSQQIMDGRTDDPTTLVAIFAAAPDDDWNDETVWHKANPSLGLSPTVDALRADAREAVNNPRQEARFRCYHLNQWIDEYSGWLNIRSWDACAPNPDAWRNAYERLRGRRCYGGFDVSKRRDVTALAWIFPPEEAADAGRWQVVTRFWVPEDTLEERLKIDRIDYGKWVDAGAMETTPGNMVDQEFVKHAILDGFRDFEPQVIGYDSWNAAKLITDLQLEGIEAEHFLEVRQGIRSLCAPSEEFECRVFAGTLDHGGQPVLRWMAGNAVVKYDDNLNFMPAKKRSKDKIDGIMAVINAIAAEMSMTAPDDDLGSLIDAGLAVI